MVLDHKGVTPRRGGSDRGFSLIELLIYMVIVGILVAIAVPAVAAYRHDGYVTAMKDDLKSAATAMESYYTLNDQYPTTVANVKASGYRQTAGVAMAEPYVFAPGDTYCLQDTDVNSSNTTYSYTTKPTTTTPTASHPDLAGSPQKGTCASLFGGTLPTAYVPPTTSTTSGSGGGGSTAPPPPSPSLTSISPTTSQIGHSVTLTGANLGSSQSTSTINFTDGGTTAHPATTSWGSTQVSFVVPTVSGGTTASITLTVGGTTTNYESLAISYTTVTFNYTGAPQTWTVPAGVTSATATLYGADGASSGWASSTGKGGKLVATFTTTPSQTLNIYVGGKGTYMGGATWPDGGGGCQCPTPNQNGNEDGGGSTSIRVGGTGMANAILVAGGGGADFASGTFGHGGPGGGQVGGAGTLNTTYGSIDGGEGQGGTQISGGNSGGTQPNGGPSYDGGGGGGGWYGGGGGGYIYNYYGGAGGGGSSYVSPSISAAGITNTQGGNTTTSGVGSLTIQY